MNSEITRPIKILQFGGGNFIRAFADWTFQKLNDTTDFNAGVLLIKPTEGGDYHQLRNQNGKYHSLLEGPTDGQLISEIDEINVIDQIIQPYHNFEAYLNSAKLESIRFIVSNTTEAGICFNPSDKYEDQPAREFPAKLTQWLFARFTHFKGAAEKGCYLLPLELIENNGETLKKCVLKYIGLWNLGPDFKNWIVSKNQFCNTLVDRIVTGYPEDKIKTIEDKSLKNDCQLVAGERYMSWLIETPAFKTLKKELPLDQLNLNIQFTDNLKPYRDLKVRVLNGAHTAMVAVGYLSGAKLVREVMANPTTATYVKALLFAEICPSFADLPQASTSRFAKDTLERFENPNLAHKLMDIALNGCSKFEVRLWPSLRDYYQLYNELPKLLVFSLACLIKLYEGTDLNGNPIALQDDQELLKVFKTTWRSYRDETLNLETLVQTFMNNEVVFSEAFSKIPNLEEQLLADLDQILSLPFETVLKQKLN